jgi:hypothetical protein
MGNLLDLRTQVVEETAELVGKRVIRPTELFAKDVLVDFALHLFLFESRL